MHVRSQLCTIVVILTALIANSAPSGAAALQHLQRAGSDALENAYPSQIAAAPDGSLWFTENRGVEHFIPPGRFHLYAVPGAGGAFGDNTPGSLVVDAQGTVWFTSGPDIGRIDVTGRLTFIPVSARLGRPVAITLGPTGTLWCVLQDANRAFSRFAKISSNGQVHPVFSWPAKGTLPGSTDQLDAYALGPGDRLWFADTFVTNVTQGSGPSFVGYLDTHLRLVRFPLPTSVAGACNPDQCIPISLRIGTDGILWFGLEGPGLGRMPPESVPQITALPRSAIIVTAFAPGAAGSVWFSAIGAGIGHVSRAGQVNYIVVSRTRTEAYEDITAASNGSLWFTVGCENGIGHATATGVITITHIPGTIADAGDQCPNLP